MYLTFTRVHLLTPLLLKTSIHKAIIAAGISTMSLWQEVPPGPLRDVLDVVGSFFMQLVQFTESVHPQVCEQHPWLAKYCNDWPATAITKQYFRNNRNGAHHDARNVAAADAAAAAAT
jgi:hypothetical protein